MEFCFLFESRFLFPEFINLIAQWRDRIVAADSQWSINHPTASSHHKLICNAGLLQVLDHVPAYLWLSTPRPGM